MITSETVKSAIANVLSENFKDYKIYKNKVKQSVFPCFFIRQLDSNDKKIARGKYERDYLINIRCHINKPNYTKLDEIGFNLFEILEVIENQDIRLVPRKFNYEIEDDVLQVFITYKVRLHKELTNKAPKMQNLKINEEVL